MCIVNTVLMLYISKGDFEKNLLNNQDNFYQFFFLSQC